MAQVDLKDMRQRPITITSEVKRGDATVFIVRVGDTDASRTARYFEVQLVGGDHSIRAEWEPAVSRMRPRQDGFAFRLSIDNGEPKEVIFKDGELYEAGDPESAFRRPDSFLNEAAARETLRRFWIFDESDVERARTIAPRFAPNVAFASEVTEWAGCEADFAGAGAGVGAVAGSVAGLKGAGAGAVVGGVAGAAFGLGYCTAQAVCG